MKNNHNGRAYKQSPNAKDPPQRNKQAHTWIVYDIETLPRVKRPHLPIDTKYVRKCTYTGCRVVHLLDEAFTVIKLYDRRRNRRDYQSKSRRARKY